MLETIVRRLSKHVSQKRKTRILNWLPYRIYARSKLSSPMAAFRCELTTKCNSKCEMCSRGDISKQHKFIARDMDGQVVDRVIEEMGKFYKAGSKMSFTVMGLGEPLLFKDLFNLLKRIKHISSEITTVIVTNGILLDEQICNEIVKLEINEISISLNVNNADEYRKRMKVDHYERVMENIKRLIKIRNESGRRYPGVFVQYLNFHGNIDHYENDIKAWLQIMQYNDKCYIHPIVNEGANFSGESKFGENMQKYPCVAPYTYIAVNVLGDIYPCDASFFSGQKRVDPLYLGNIMIDSPFEMMRDKNHKRYKIIEYMQKDEYSKIPNCSRCNNCFLTPNLFFKLPGGIRISGKKWV